MLHACQERRRLQQAGARRGQLHRQRQPVQAATQFGHRRRIAVDQRKVRIRGLRPIDEQLDRGHRCQTTDGPGRALRTGHRKRLHLDDLLPPQLERFAAGDEHGQGRAIRQQGVERWHGGEQMFEVVE